MNRFLSARAQNTRQNTRAIDPATVGATARFGRPNVNFGVPGGPVAPAAGNPMMNPAIRDAVMGAGAGAGAPPAPAPAPAPAAPTPIPARQTEPGGPVPVGHPSIDDRGGW